MQFPYLNPCLNMQLKSPLTYCPPYSRDIFSLKKRVFLKTPIIQVKRTALLPPFLLWTEGRDLAQPKRYYQKYAASKAL